MTAQPHTKPAAHVDHTRKVSTGAMKASRSARASTALGALHRRANTDAQDATSTQGRASPIKRVTRVIYLSSDSDAEGYDVRETGIRGEDGLLPDGQDEDPIPRSTDEQIADDEDGDELPMQRITDEQMADNDDGDAHLIPRITDEQMIDLEDGDEHPIEFNNGQDDEHPIELSSTDDRMTNQDDKDEPRFKIMGSYVNDGTTIPVSRSQMPSTVVDGVIELIQKMDDLRPDWELESREGECIGKRVSGQTRYKWAKEEKQAACQTCTNARSYCLRWSPESPDVLVVVALTASLREGVQPTDPDFWMRDRSPIQKRNTSAKLWT